MSKKVIRLRQVSREQERDYCIHYYECLTRAARIEAPWIPCLGCDRYVRDPEAVDELAQVIQISIARRK